MLGEHTRDMHASCSEPQPSIHSMQYAHILPAKECLAAQRCTRCSCHGPQLAAAALMEEVVLLTWQAAQSHCWVAEIPGLYAAGLLLRCHLQRAGQVAKGSHC